MVTTQGLNPRMADNQAFIDAANHVNQVLGQSVCGDTCLESIRFFGAGCGTTEMQSHVGELLAKCFCTENVEVNSDMMAACLAVCGNKGGVAAILGTGSNACVFDGHHIVKQVTSTGYILGDEGSGNHIGRKLLKDYLTGRMPETLSSDFKDHAQGSVNDILQRLYNGEYPNRYLAGFAKFASYHRKHGYIQNLLHDVFSQFWQEMIIPIAETPTSVGFVGGVAAAFAKEIADSAPQGFGVDSAVKEPIEKLMSLHDASVTNQ